MVSMAFRIAALSIIIKIKPRPGLCGDCLVSLCVIEEKGSQRIAMRLVHNGMKTFCV